MKQKNIILAVWSAVVLAGCVEIDDYHRLPEESEVEYGTNVSAEQQDFVVPECREEKMMVVYDKNGAFEVPGCSDFVDDADVEAVDMAAEREEVNPDEIEGEFPEVPNNKYYQGAQIVLQNLNTRTLAYCRGSEKEAEACAKRLESTCYVRVTNIPSVAAKYDKLRQGSYPTRRWRNGEVVPRW